MSNEPKWPTNDEIVAKALDSADGTPTLRMVAEIASGLFRAAWLAENDDPSQSPEGEIRRDPNRTANWVAVRLGAVAAGLTSQPWLVLSPAGYTDGAVNEYVKGWPVVGAVPGSPAAEAQR